MEAGGLWANGCDDDLRDCIRILMFPEAEHSPSGIAQKVVCLAIALDVPLQLRQPIVGVALGQARMLWTPVPEAAVDEDRNLPLREHNIRSASPPERSEIYSVPHTRGVDSASHSGLRLRVAPAVGEHRTPRPFAAGPGHTSTVVGFESTCPHRRKDRQSPKAPVR